MSAEIIYILFITVIILVFCAIYLIIKQRDSMQNQINFLSSTINDQNQKYQTLLNELARDLGDSFTDKFYYLNKSLGDGIFSSNQNLNTNLSNIELTFKNVIEKIAKIENSTQITLGIKDEISKLNLILANQKQKGNFGEYQLERVLELVYGSNLNFYELQKTLSNGKIADCVIKIKKDKYLCIDSKFPLTSYEKICESSDSKELKYYNNELTKDIKKYIADISLKYIIPSQTSQYAVLFIPSEAVFVHVCSNLEGIMEFAGKNSVFIASPTTLMSLLYSLKIFTRDENIVQNAKLIRDEILILSTKFQNQIKHSQLLEAYAKKLHDQTKILKENSKSIKDSFDKFNIV